MTAPRASVAGFVAWTLRHGRVLWLVALVLAIPAALRTAWLYGHLRSDLEALLPPSAPSVVALDELRHRATGAQYLGVVVDAGEPSRLDEAERFLDALAARIRTYGRDEVAAVRLGDEEERRFLSSHGGLYLDVPDLETVLARVRARKEFEIGRETGSLLDEDEAAPPLDFGDLRAKYDARVPHPGSDRSGRFVNRPDHLAVLLVELGAYTTGTAEGKRLIERVQHDIAAVGLPHGMRVGFSGDAAISVEELTSLVTDLSIASAFVVIAVLTAIIVYYRWWRSIVVFPPLLVAAVLAFGVASLPPFSVTSLNSNTAFLGSIIVGNGINFGLILLSRYVEARRAGEDVEPALVTAVRGARGGTLAAAAAAGASYASLAATQFRGFRQFGFIGALGMAFAWITAFVLMPPLVRWIDRGEATRPAPRPETTRVSFWVARGVHRAPRLLLALTALVTVIAAISASRIRLNDIETDFSKLRRRDTWTSGEGYWGKKMNRVLGEYLTPFVFLADSPEEARDLAARVRAGIASGAFEGQLERVRTIEDVLPGAQDEKVRLLGAIREELTPKVMASLAPDQRDFVDRFLREPPRTIGLDDLPHTFLLGLRERDGTVGRIVLVYPSVSSTWWDANEMRDFVGTLRGMAAAAAGPSAAPPRLAGSVPLSSDIIEAVRRDAPLASVLSFAGVIVVVLLLLGPRMATVEVIGALVVGVLWLVGVSRLFGIHINFANFIALPITFGIGVDYAVNVVSRWEQDRSAGILAAVRSTGAAVALCSLTTIIGYSSLLLAANRALFLFGALAVLGEIACLVVALVGLPALVLVAFAGSTAGTGGAIHSPWWRRRSREHDAPGG